ncbi:MAG: SPOCS domain-containing protein [Aminipila sp.]
MTYDKDIPDFALQPARDPDAEDQFDPSPYDRLLNFYAQDTKNDDGFDPLQESKGLDVEAKEEFDQVETEDREFNEFPPLQGFSGKESEEEQESVYEESLKTPDFVAEEVPSEAQVVEEKEEVVETIAHNEEELYFEMDSEESEPVVEVDAEEASATFEAGNSKTVVPTVSPVNGDVALIVPAPGTLMTNELKMTDIREKPEIKVYVEEDILVPDTKEDLASILSMTGKARLSDSEIRITQPGQDLVKVNGEIDLHTLYIPENYEGEHHIINIQSRLPFKTDWSVDVGPQSRLVIKPYIESIDYTVINERKFRAKLTVRLAMREYANVEMQVFQGIKGEKLQLLKEKIQMTHVSERKTDTIEIDEVLPLKDTQPKPERILKYDIDIVENHKQITEDKAVINATIYCNVLYLGSQVEGERADEDADDITKLVPQLFQGKTEFTQFIPLSNPAEGSKIAFNYNNLNVKIKSPTEEEPMENAFSIQGDVETSIEIYKNLEREIVTDIYHRTKDIVCDKVELEAMSLGGSGVTEAAVREIINVPEKYGEVKKVIYIFGTIKNSQSFLEQNKNIVEGVVDITLLCLPEDEKKPAFTLNKDINFRGSMEIPMGRGDTKANSEIAIKELWFDRINTKQIEVNANLFISSSVYGQDKYQVIQNVCFVESKEEQGAKPGMVVYITKAGDTLWDIAKKYRTTTDMITEINELAEEQPLKPGMKLLIVK